MTIPGVAKAVPPFVAATSNNSSLWCHFPFSLHGVIVADYQQRGDLGNRLPIDIRSLAIIILPTSRQRIVSVVFVRSYSLAS